MRWLSRKRREQDLERELRVDLELEAEEQQSAGLTRAEALFAARRAFGNTTRTKEEVRHMWGWMNWDILRQDIRYAVRTLRKSRGFAATAILTLALGIGASTAVFTVVDTVVLRPLGFRDSGSLVVVWERVRGLGADPTGPNPRHVDVWQKRASAFSGLTLMRNTAMGLTAGADHPRLVGVVACVPNLLDVLEAPPFLGRDFRPEDGTAGHDNVAILTYSLWQSLFLGDPAAIGRTIRLDDKPREVIGVLPAGFHFPNANALPAFRSKQPVRGVAEPAVFIPAILDPSQFSWSGDYGNWVTIARLKPGVSVRQAEAQLATIEVQIVQEMPANQGDHRPGSLRASVQPMQEAIVGESKTGLWLLMAAVLGLMLIACLNLANTQLGRALSRQREIALRTALGAGKWRLVRASLTENLLLAVTGGVAGILLADWALDLFRRYSPVDLPRLSEVRLNPAVLAFAVFLAFGSSLLSGMLPVLRLLYTDPQASLQQNNGRAMGGIQGRRLRSLLIGLQVFGCTALLLITGLFSKSLLHLLRQERGFETEHVAIAEAMLSAQGYEADQRRMAFDDVALGNLRALPGVQAAGLVSAMPLEGETWIEPVMRMDRPSREGPMNNLRWVSAGYFEATRQRLVAGRFFEERDRTLNSVVLSEGEVKALWGDENPIGAEVKIRGRTRTVIGVVADSRSTSLKSAPARMAYLHYKDRPPYTSFFLVRSAQSADALVSGMRQAIWQSAPDVTIPRVKTLESQLADSLATERVQSLVLLAFGIAALLLAMLGIYGVLSYSVATRKQEIGVRMALGATRLSVYALTLGEAGTPVVAGLAAGLGASVLSGRGIQKLLYGIEVMDPAVISMVVVLFLAAAAAAGFLPARRAASVDPMEALRSE